MKAGKKILRKAAVGLLALSLCIGLLAGASFAADDAFEETLYTVRILPGKQGTLPGGILVYPDMHYGDTITFSINQVSISPDSKYYVKGLKDSGMDPNHPTSDFSNTGYLSNSGDTWTIRVTKDQDFVVSYGLKGSAVQYTVNYVDTNGNPIAPANIYYGTIGDEAVVSYIYIEGYNPLAESESLVLSEDPGRNVLTLKYEKVQTAAQEPTGDGASEPASESGTDSTRPTQPTTPTSPTQPTTRPTGGQTPAPLPVVVQTPVTPGTPAPAGQQPATTTPDDQAQKPEDQTQQPGATGQPEEVGGQEMVETPDGEVPVAYFNETSNDPFGFRIPGVEYNGAEGDITPDAPDAPDAEPETSEDGSLIEIGDGSVPLGLEVIAAGTDFIVKNDHINFEYHYDQPDTTDRYTAFPGDFSEE